MPSHSESESDAPPLSAGIDKFKEETPQQKREKEMRNLEQSVRMASSEDESTQTQKPKVSKDEKVAAPNHTRVSRVQIASSSGSSEEDDWF